MWPNPTDAELKEQIDALARQNLALIDERDTLAALNETFEKDLGQARDEARLARQELTEWQNNCACVVVKP